MSLPKQAKVALDTNGCYTNRAGVARYIRGLKRGLEELAPEGLELREIAWPMAQFDYKQPWRAMKTAYRELIWAKWHAPSLLRRYGAELMHSPVNVLVEPPRGIRHVVTLHDLAILRHPERFRCWLRWAGRRRLEKVVKADRIICISRFTADEAMRCLDVKAGQIEVVWNGCEFHPDAEPSDEAKPEASLPGEFFLFIGSLEPGKNLGLLRDAYLEAERAGRPLPPLVVVGARWEGVASEGRHPEGWIYMGYQPDEVIVHLYRRALALVFPSIYEGFGFPLVEAMALGCPVVCSPVASLKEIGEGAALFTSMTVEGYIDACRRVSEQSELRAEMRAMGRERARQFSWRRCAQETYDVYTSVLSQ